MFVAPKIDPKDSLPAELEAEIAHSIIVPKMIKPSSGDYFECEVEIESGTEENIKTAETAKGEESKPKEEEIDENNLALKPLLDYKTMLMNKWKHENSILEAYQNKH